MGPPEARIYLQTDFGDDAWLDHNGYLINQDGFRIDRQGRIMKKRGAPGRGFQQRIDAQNALHRQQLWQARQDAEVIERQRRELERLSRAAPQPKATLQPRASVQNPPPTVADLRQPPPVAKAAADAVHYVFDNRHTFGDAPAWDDEGDRGFGGGANR